MTEFKISTDACDVLWQHWSPWEHQIWSWTELQTDLQLWSVISTALTSLNTRTEGTFCGRWLVSVSDDHFDYHSIFCVSSIRVESHQHQPFYSDGQWTFLMLKTRIFTTRYCKFCAWSCEHTACINGSGIKFSEQASLKLSAQDLF